MGRLGEVKYFNLSGHSTNRRTFNLTHTTV